MKISKHMKKCAAGLTALALALVIGVKVAPTTAYFTDYESAVGRETVTITMPSPTPTEPSVDPTTHTKTIEVSNSGDVECWVRVKVIVPSSFGDVTYTPGPDWTAGGDGYYYYGKVLEAGGNTSDLLASVDIPEGLDQDDFNMEVMMEYAPVFYEYDEDGNATPIEADWSLAVAMNGGEG